MTLSEARRLLGVEPGADPADLARTFRAAVKRAHPDRPGGSAEQFRLVVEAHERLARARPRSARGNAAVVRGSDLWITAAVDPRVLNAGGRLVLDTPDGKRIVWVTRRVGRSGLVRLAGQGLATQPGGPRGRLFVRLTACERSEDGARILLRRFAAAWAA